MDEPTLSAALRRGDPAAVSVLFDRYGQRLLRSAYLLCGNETEAQDLTQDTFVQAMRSAHRFRGGSSLYTWLHAILLNLVRHYHRKRRPIVCDDALAREQPDPGAEETPFAADTALAHSRLGAALQTLSLPHREVLILRYFENMRVDQIAAHAGVSRGTVKSRLHYAIAALQRQLPEELNVFTAAGTKG